MGLVRFLLAVAVVLYHSYYLVIGDAKFRMMDGSIAVQAFYLISGFYMQLILSEKYKGLSQYKLFISNRFLRLYPVYWVVLLLAFGISFLSWKSGGNAFYLSPWVNRWIEMGSGTISFLILINLFIFGQDQTFFFQTSKAGGMRFVSDFGLAIRPLHTFLLVPPAWTLSLEMMFYLLAPLIARLKSYWLILLVAASWGLRYYLYKDYQRGYDPWTYRYFPHEIATFVMGMLAWRLGEKTKNWKISDLTLQYFWGFLILFILTYYFNPMEEVTGKWLFENHLLSVLKFMVSKNGLLLEMLFLGLPFLFRISKDLSWDRWIGELSFPLYICHHLVLTVLKPWFWADITNRLTYFGTSVLIVSVVFAIVLNYVLVRPLERYRQARVSS